MTPTTRLRPRKLGITKTIQENADSIQAVDSIVRSFLVQARIFDNSGRFINTPIFNKVYGYWIKGMLPPDDLVTEALAVPQDASGWKAVRCDGTVRFRNDNLAIKNFRIRVEFVPKAMVIISSLDKAAIPELGLQINADVDTFQNMWNRLGPTRLFSEQDRTDVAAKIQTLQSLWPNVRTILAAPIQCKGKSDAGVQTDPPFYYVTFEFPIIRSLAECPRRPSGETRRSPSQTPYAID